MSSGFPKNPVYPKWVIIPAMMKHLHTICLILALALYLAAALLQLRLPGLHHDEAQEAGLQAMQLLTGRPVTLFRGVGIAGRFPIMVQDYIGAQAVYIAIPFLALGGITVEALRASFVAVGLATLALVYAVGREVWGKWVGAGAALLLATMPSYVFWTRQGVLIASATLPISLGAFWAGVRWRRTGSSRYLALGAFLLGFGLYAKLLFLWFAVAAIFMGVVVHAGDIRRQIGHWRPAGMISGHCKEAIIAVAAFLMGLSPLIVYNLMSGGTLASISGNLSTSYYGVNNADFVGNLSVRLREVRDVLDGTPLAEGFGATHSNPLMTPAFLLAAALGLGAAIYRRDRPTAWLLGTTALMVVQSCFTVSALWHTHFGLHLPWFALVIAVGLVRGIPWGAARTALIAILVAWNLLNVAGYHQALAQTGGRLSFSSAIYTLAARLDGMESRPPVAALDWGVGPAVEFLTVGRVQVAEIFGYDWEPDPGFEARVERFLAMQEALFVLHAPDRTVFPRREAFLAILAQHDEIAYSVEVVHAPDGAPFFEIYRTVNSGAISRLAPDAIELPAGLTNTGWSPLPLHPAEWVVQPGPYRRRTHDPT